MKRTQEFYIFDKKINADKMVFLFGPRQVGKTTFAQNQLKSLGDNIFYFNWDDPYVRREYIRNPHFLNTYLSQSHHEKPLIVFDEIHKHKDWKNILKGLYDIHHTQAQFMVTGSARLDYFRSSGDSLVGRYFSYAMFPLCLAEATQNFEKVILTDDILAYPEQKKLLTFLQRIEVNTTKKSFNQLLEFGGFPEPFLKHEKSFSIKWRRDYLSVLTKEDLRDLTRIHDLKGIEQLCLLLPERVGSPLSINSLREDLDVAYKTAALWLEALKKIYLIFFVKPWYKGVARSLKKEAKCYFYDWTCIEDPGARFETMTAVMLLRMTSRFNELGLGNFDLHYLRTKDQEEIDFLMTKNNKPFALFEAKKSQKDIPRAARSFSRTLGVPYYQLVADTTILEAYPDNIYVLDAQRFFLITG